MTTTIEYIKQLREITGAGILECRLALESSNYSYEAALIELKERAAAKAAGKSERETLQGTVEVYAHNGGRIGVMLEVNCETDFTARSDRFRALVHELALQIAAESPLWVVDADIPETVLDQEREKVTARARAEGKPETLFPRICDGAIKKYMDRTVLLRQASIHNESVSVAQLLAQTAGAVGENIVVRRFVRWELAEGLVSVG
jgi:elongation factor Ts